MRREAEGSRRRRVARAGIAQRTVVAGLVMSSLLGAALSTTLRAPAAGASTVSCANGTITNAYAGYCTTIDGANTWYGSYGGGFPTSVGWAICAEEPASGKWFPLTSYAYASGAAPSGSNTAGDPAFGFAMSQAQALGDFAGASGYNANDIAEASKVIYDNLAWSDAVPSLTGGPLAAYNTLRTCTNEATGTTGRPAIEKNSGGLATLST